MTQELKLTPKMTMNLIRENLVRQRIEEYKYGQGEIGRALSWEQAMDEWMEKFGIAHLQAHHPTRVKGLKYRSKKNFATV